MFRGRRFIVFSGFNAFSNDNYRIKDTVASAANNSFSEEFYLKIENRLRIATEIAFNTQTRERHLNNNEITIFILWEKH